MSKIRVHPSQILWHCAQTGLPQVPQTPRILSLSVVAPQISHFNNSVTQSTSHKFCIAVCTKQITVNHLQTLRTGILLALAAFSSSDVFRERVSAVESWEIDFADGITYRNPRKRFIFPEISLTLYSARPSVVARSRCVYRCPDFLVAR